MRSFLFLWVSLAAICTISAQESPKKQDPGDRGKISEDGKFTPTPPQDETTTPKSPEAALEELMGQSTIVPQGKGKFKLGLVEFNATSKTLAIPVRVNMVENPVEYVLVHEDGKKHESILTTTARPEHIHLACLLLGTTPLSIQNWPKDQQGIPKLNCAQVQLKWATNGPDRVVDIAELITFQNHPNTSSEYPKGPWLYSGSYFRGGGFAAQAEGSIISIIGDHAALINGLRSTRQNDEQHIPNPAALPRKGRNATLEIKLQQP